MHEGWVVFIPLGITSLKNIRGGLPNNNKQTDMRNWLIVLIMIFIPSVCHAQTWNRVWHEDFGVVEDSVIRDFPDPSMSMQDHRFNECHTIEDGWYGIMNNTWWSFRRKLSLNCSGMGGDHFYPGNDHTDPNNKQGGMLVVNVNYDCIGVDIYRHTINFDICGNSKYKLGAYLADISSGGSLRTPILTMLVVNVKDPANPDTIATADISTSTIWEWADGSSNPHMDRTDKWNYNEVEFDVQAGDVLQLVIVNQQQGGGGNDFALDDIELYRWDQNEAPKPAIDVKRSYKLTEGGNGCTPEAIYNVSNDIIPDWKQIYDHIYCLWQVSTDGGFQWQDIDSESGEEKTSMSRDINQQTATEMYRLVITGGNTIGDAEAEARHIGATGGPSNGCAYYTISNTIASVKPTPEEVVPPAELNINNTAWHRAELDVDCKNSTDQYTIDLTEDDWSNTQHVRLWQYSTDMAQSWQTLPVNQTSITFDKTLGRNVYYRVVMAKTQEVAEQVAKNGYPDNPCEKFYYITDTTLFTCIKSCDKPEFDVPNSSGFKVSPTNPREWNRTTCFKSPTTEWEVVQTNNAPIDSIHWYIRGNKEADWQLIPGESNLKLIHEQTYDTTQVLFLAWSEECVSDTFIFTVETILLHPELSPMPDKACEGADITLTAINTNPNLPVGGWAVLERSYDGVSFEDVAGGETGQENYHSNPFNLTYQIPLSQNNATNSTYYYRVRMRESDACSWAYSNIVTVSIEKPNTFTLDDIPQNVCVGGTVQLNANVTLRPSNTFAWLRNGDTLSTTELSLVDIPEDSTTYIFVLEDQLCATMKDTITSVTLLPDSIHLSTMKDSLCSGDEATLYVTRKDNGIPLIWEYSTDSMQTFNELTAVGDTITEPVLAPTYFRARTDGSSCQIIYSDTVFIYTEKRVEVEIDQLPDTICDGVEVNLTARAEIDSTLNTYTWVVNEDTLRNVQKFDISEVPLIATTYRFVVFGNLCPPQEDTTHTVVYTEHGVEIEIDKDTVCEGETVRVTAEYDYNATVVWQRTYDRVTYEDFMPDEVPNDLIQRPNEVPKVRPTANLKPDATTYYRVKVPASSVCPTTFSFTVIAHVEKKAENIIVNELPSEICAGTSVGLKATADIDPSLNTFAWIKNGDTLSTSEMELTDIPNQNTTYEFAVAGKYCGPQTKSQDVKVEKSGNIGLEIDKDYICLGEMARLNVLWDQQTSVTWEKSQDSINFSQFDPNTDVSALFPSNTTYYRIKSASSSTACPEVYSDVVRVNVEKKIEVEVDSIPAYLCEGTSVSLNAHTTLDPRNTFAWIKDGDTLSTNELELSDTPTENTSYQLVIKGINCPSFQKSFQTEVEKPAKVSLSASETGVCEGTDVTFDAQTENIKGLAWQRKSADEGTFATIDETTLDKLTITAEESSTYRIISTGDIACPSDTSAEINLTVEKNITFDLTERVVICPKTETVVDAHFSGEPKSVTWEKRGKSENDYSVFSNSTDPFTLSPNESAEYKMAYTMEYCPSGNGYFVVVVDQPSEMTITPADSICSGESLTLTVTADYPSSIVWESMEEGEATYQVLETEKTEIEVSPTKSTRYKVSSSTENGCTVEPVFTSIKVSEPVDNIEVIGGKSICWGDSADLYISGLTDYTEIMWLSSYDMYGTSIGDRPSYRAIPNTTAEYRVVVRNGKCEGEASASVDVHFPPEIISCEEYGTTAYKVETKSADFPLYYDYGDGSNVTTSNILSNVIFGKTYNITVSNEIGCSSSYVLETPTYDLFFPEYFVQDREKWVVENLDRYEKANLKIYDRFGKLVYDGKSTDGGWDGTYLGQKLPSTDYWYLVNIPEIDRQFQGHFTLIHN